MVDNGPWVPILPNIPGYPSNPEDNVNIPIYTSFTNPGFSFNYQDSERLGSANLRGHPIPVNKVPFTQPYHPSPTTSTEHTKPHSSTTTQPTVTKDDIVTDDLNSSMKNISSIFYDLATSLDTTNITQEQVLYQPEIFSEDREPSGQGQVEVVDVDVEELLSHTTKIPLVTLLPVRSNSGIGRPFHRNRAGETNNYSVENRSFPGHVTRHNLQLPEKPKNKSKVVMVPNPTNVSTADNYRITSILNFAREGYSQDEAARDIIRFPKMDVDLDNHKIFAGYFALPSSTSNNKYKQSNVLSPEQIKQLSEISNIRNNETYFGEQSVISTKAISSSYTVNQNGIKLLTKTYNKMQSGLKNTSQGFNAIENECDQSSFKCGDDKCLPESTKCNQLIDCVDGSDEDNCNCADYLKSQLLVSKICDGVVDCWDFSDENHCSKLHLCQVVIKVNGDFFRVVPTRSVRLQ